MDMIYSKMKRKIIEINPVNPVNPVKNMKPIEMWKELISSESNEQEMRMRLEEIYRNNRPFIAEIIMNSHCPSRCLHCIYAPDYERYNKNMAMSEWEAAFRIIHDTLGFKKFILDGRGFSRESIQAIRYLKENFEGIKVGLIMDGVSAEPFIEELIQYPPDWLDVSVDGLEREHDKQRNHEGAYRKTIDALIQLKESQAFEKINILTCLTTINIESLPFMMNSLNMEGFKNFFVAPVSILSGYRPDKNLQPTEEEFVRFLDELMGTTRSLSDSWVEVDIYDALFSGAIRHLRAEIFKEFKTEKDHLEMVQKLDGNEIHVCYFPSSLIGAREFIVNSDGTIIPPKVMAMGKIPSNMIMGNVLALDKEKRFFDQLTEHEVFSVFTRELIEERDLLGALP